MLDSDSSQATERPSSAAVVRRLWPEPSRDFDLLAALRELGLEDDAADLQSAREVLLARQAMTKPIVAVLGELNGGKSSVVATFLSAAGRSRLPRGIEGAKGTHRFVYWVPARWLQDHAIQRALNELLAAVHGPGVEMLSLDPNEAERQYRAGLNDRACLQLPVIAADPALDELDVALLDCPDVQTRDADQDAEANTRLDFVAKAARICSAFCVLWERAKISDRLFSDLLRRIRERLPKARLFVLLNKIEPAADQPTRTRRDPDVQRYLADFQVAADACYGAFHFKIRATDDAPGWDDLTPPALVRQWDSKDPLPQFFALAESEELNQPERIGEDRFLQSLPRRLDPGEQQKADAASALASVQAGATKLEAQAIRAASERSAKLERAHRGLLELCAGCYRDEVTGEERQELDPRFAKALQASFERTAPWWAKIPLYVQSWSKTVRDTVSSTAAMLSQFVSDVRDQVLKSLNLSWVSSRLDQEGAKGAAAFDATFFSQKMLASRWCPNGVLETDVVQAWTCVIREQQAFAPQFDEGVMDRATQVFWENLSWYDSSRVIALSVFSALWVVASIAAMATALADGGTTILLTYSVADSILWGSAVLTGGAAYVSLSLASIRLSTLPALINLFFHACDVFDLPRTLDDYPLIATGFGRDRKRQHVLPPLDTPRLPVVCSLGLQRWRPIVNDGKGKRNG